MPRGYRLPIIAVAGWLALTGWAEGHSGGKGAYYKQQAAAGQDAEPTYGPPPFNNPPNAVSVQSPCNNPVSENERDLCQQWRMAEAADQLVNVSWLQAVLTGLSLLGLGFTIYYTHQAAVAAFAAATASKQSADAALVANANTLKAIAQEQANAQRQLRAYVGMSSGGITLDLEANRAVGIVVMKNFGQTPAHQVEFWVSIRLIDASLVMEMPTPAKKREELSKAMLSPSQTSDIAIAHSFESGELQAVRDGRSAFFIRGWIEYTDVFRDHQRTNISYKMNGPEYPFVKDNPRFVGWALRPTNYGNEAT